MVCPLNSLSRLIMYFSVKTWFKNATVNLLPDVSFLLHKANASCITNDT